MACTSFSFTLGPERIDQQLSAACPNAKVTDMARAQAGAIAALGACRVALLTPYIGAMADKNAEMLEAGGEAKCSRRRTALPRALGLARVRAAAFQLTRLAAAGGVTVVSRATMLLERDEQTTAVLPACIAEWAAAVDCAEAEVVVIGCSAFRACEYGFIDELVRPRPRCPPLLRRQLRQDSPPRGQLVGVRGASLSLARGGGSRRFLEGRGVPPTVPLISLHALQNWQELQLGKPVVTSTQAFMWSMLRTAGVDDQIKGYGKLLSAH